MENDSPTKWIEELPVIPMALMSVNLSLFIYVVAFPQWSPYSFLCVALPIFIMTASNDGMTSASFYLIVFLIVITGLAGIALTYLRMYKYGSLIFLICGLLTFPLGLLGIIASVMVWQHSMAPKCIKCKSAIKKDRTRPGYFYCSRCGTRYGSTGRRNIL